MIRLPCFFFLSENTRVDVREVSGNILIFKFHCPNEDIVVKEYKKDRVAAICLLTANLPKLEMEALRVFTQFYLKPFTQN